ncbi:MAG: metal-dependent hydrolase [Kiritimatiellaeota bacterium]|nr:metal-dependent hydrolase [Kiritimatiellota bacterium]
MYILMPSPVAHSLIGLALGAAFFVPRARGASLRATLRPSRGLLCLSVAAATAADLDYLPGLFMGSLNAAHRLYTHTLGWSLLAALALWLIGRWWPARGADRPGAVASGWLAFIGLTLIALSHLAADWVTEDLRPPYGLMALWPINSHYYIAPHVLFLHLQKADFSQFFCRHNAWAVTVELAWCLPPLLAVLFYKQARIRHAHPPR